MSQAGKQAMWIGGRWPCLNENVHSQVAVLGVRERPEGKSESQCLRPPSLFCYLCVFIPTRLCSNLVMIFRSCFKKRKVDLLNLGGFHPCYLVLRSLLSLFLNFRVFRYFGLWDQFVPVYFTFFQGFPIFPILWCQTFLFSPSHLWIRLDI